MMIDLPAYLPIYPAKVVKQTCLEYFNGDELATDVVMNKYLLKDKEGRFRESSPDDIHWRMAREFARTEQKYDNPLTTEQIYSYFKGFGKIIPQGSPMSGIGNPFQIQSLGNCFVIDSPHDSYGGIMKADQEIAQLAKRRAGIGGDISSIRPRGLPTNNAARTTDGLGVFMERYSNTCREVAQGGRRGALLLSTLVHHPDIRTFLSIKKDLKKVTGANLSIRLSDEFMRSVESKTDVELRWPEPDPKRGIFPILVDRVDADSLWNDITTSAWEVAEPGLLYWDTILNRGPADIYPEFRSISTNPCGEIPLSKDSCRLILLNLMSFVKNPFTDQAYFDVADFSDSVRVGQRLMDDLVDLELEAIDRILEKIYSDPEPLHVKEVEINLWKSFRESCERGRRTGLGITALADCLAALGIRYGSDGAIVKTEEIYRNLAVNSYWSSCNLAKERGAFPAFDRELEKGHVFLEQIWEASPEAYDLYKVYGRRNVANTTTPPAGSVSILTQTTSGFDACFLLSYDRRRKVDGDSARIDFVDAMGDKWQMYTVYHHGFQRWMNITGKTDPAQSPYHGATANEIDWIGKVKMQAAAQKWVCHAISTTTNIPNDTPLQVVKDIYMAGWKLGCKGLTVYRDGCRSGVLVPTSEKKTIDHRSAPKRPEVLPCEIHKVKVKKEEWMLLVGLLDGSPYEIFGGKADLCKIPSDVKHGTITKHPRKASGARYSLSFGDSKDGVGDIDKAFSNESHGTLTRLVSMSLRHGVPIQYLVEQLQKDDNADLHDLSRVIARVLKKHVPEGLSRTNKTCPECNQNSLAYQGGCLSCTNCGYSKC